MAHQKYLLQTYRCEQLSTYKDCSNVQFSVGLAAGAGGDLLHKQFFCELPEKPDFFSPQKITSQLNFSLPQKAKTTCIHLLFTHCGHYENASFLLLDLVQPCYSHIAWKKKEPQQKSIFVSGMAEFHSLLQITQCTKTQSSDKSSLSSDSIAAVPVLAHQATCNFPNGIQGSRPVDFQLDLCFQIPQMLLNISTLPDI